MTATLQDVMSAAVASQTAAARLRATVARAHRDGAAISDLAEAARVTRPTIYRWIAMETDEIPSTPVHLCLQQALELMSSLIVDQYQAGEVRKRAHAPVESQLIGMRMAAAWLPSDAWQQMSDEDRMIMAQATDAENRWIAAHRHG